MSQIHVTEIRIIGKRQQHSIEKSCTPISLAYKWVEEMSQYETKIPKGVFRYCSHAAANADWEKWHAEKIAAVDLRKAIEYLESR